jgi:hypothetical protein
MPLENIAYVAGRIREIFGAQGEIKHTQEMKVGHTFHYFSNSHADYVACHAMKLSATDDSIGLTNPGERVHDDLDWYLFFSQLYAIDGAVAIQGKGVAKMIANSPIEQSDLSALVIGKPFIDAIGGDEAAANFVYDRLEPKEPYLTILRVPKSVKRATHVALNTICLISHDLLLHDNAEKKKASESQRR